MRERTFSARSKSSFLQRVACFLPAGLTLICLAFAPVLPAQEQVPSSTKPSQSTPLNSGDQAARPAEASASGEPQRIRVTQAVTQGLLIHKVAPVYPESAKANHIQGTVVLAVRIAKEGTIESLKAIKGPPELYDAATAAVSQWRYKPFILNGTPVVVETTINVNFILH